MELLADEPAHVSGEGCRADIVRPDLCGLVVDEQTGSYRRARRGGRTQAQLARPARTNEAATEPETSSTVSATSR